MRSLSRAVMVTTITLAPLGAALLGALASCSGAGDDGNVNEIHIPQCQGSGSFDLNGRAGVLAQLNVHINAAGLVETDASAELLLLLDVDQSGLDVGVTATVCKLTLPDIPLAGQPAPIHFEIGEALVQSVQGVSGTARVASSEVCTAFETDPITLLLGAKLDDPATSPLPHTDADGKVKECIPKSCATSILSNCACDQEGDGETGATLGASNVPAVPLERVFVALRTTFTLSGQVWSSDLLKGEVDIALEQSILGCKKAGNTPCSASEVGLVQTLNPAISQASEPSTFRAVRVPADMTCAELLAQQGELFPR